MSQPVVIHVSEDGTIRFLVSEDSKPFMTEDALVRRASHVVPVSKTLRVIFHGLRSVFGEYGWVSDFTRRWKCLWYVDLSPIGGDRLPGVYRNRAEAIAAEIQYLNEFFI